MTETAQLKKSFYGWKNVALLFVIYMLGMGIVFYGYSVIFPAMIQAMEWNRGTASIAHTINFIAMGVLLSLVAVLINKLGVKKTINLGLGLLIISLVMLGTIVSQMWQWIIVWGVMMALSLTMVGVIALQTMVIFWFDAKRATAIGIAMTGAPLGGFIAQPLYTWIISKTGSWESGWLCGAAFALAALVCSFFLVNKPQDLGQYPDGLPSDDEGPVEKAPGDKSSASESNRDRTLKEIFKLPVMWMITVTRIAHAMPLVMLTSHGIFHFTDAGLTKMEAASVLGFIILSSGLARFPAGWVADRIGPRRIVPAAMILMLFATLGIWHLKGLEGMVAAGVVFGLCFGSLVPVFPAILGSYFGPDTFAGINGVTGPILTLCVATVPVGAGFVFEKSGTYDTAFICLIILISIGAVTSFFLRPPRPAHDGG